MRGTRRAALLVGATALVLASAACRGDDRGPAPPRSSTTAPGPSSSTTTSPPSFTSSVATLTAADLPASWRPGCPVPVESLRAIDADFWGFDGRVHQGRIVVAADVVDDVTGVLHDLFAARYPIDRMEPVDHYGGRDDASVDADNTSAFNCRLATGSPSSWSEHAYGHAIDLNPLLNPYAVGDQVLPEQSRPFLDRTRTDPGVIHDGDAAVTAFGSRGWAWGGHWRTSKDYQHFSVNGR
jgi:hypothetical protein